LKVSKPVLIALVIAILLAGYIYFFTGKKKPPARVAPVLPAATVPVAVSQPAAKMQEVKPEARAQLEKIDVTWKRDPFLLPKVKTEKRRELQTTFKLVAILERGNERIAIIDHEVVKKGDLVGDEKVQEIGVDRVVLTKKNGSKRVLNLMNIEDTAPEDLTKTKSTERGK
jgi:hypothetical protein